MIMKTISIFKKMLGVAAAAAAMLMAGCQEEKGISYPYVVGCQ